VKLEIIDKLEVIKQGMGNYVALLNAVVPLGVFLDCYGLIVF
jgi:hypothetical protein